jgi:hypothetical protein
MQDSGNSAQDQSATPAGGGPGQTEDGTQPAAQFGELLSQQVWLARLALWTAACTVALAAIVLAVSAQYAEALFATPARIRASCRC